LHIMLYNGSSPTQPTIKTYFALQHRTNSAFYSSYHQLLKLST
jgi:hypothetical protein